MLSLFLLGLLTSYTSAKVGQYGLPSPWSYTCDRSNTSHLITGHVIPYKCGKVPSSSASKVQSLSACKMTCDPSGVIWPSPTEELQLSPDLVHFLPDQLKVVSVISLNEEVSNMVNRFADIFKEYLYLSHPDYEGGYKSPFTKSPFTLGTSIHITIKVETEDLSLNTDTDESYSLTVSKKGDSSDDLAVLISANTFYGARHGLETFSQMIAYDDLTDTLQTYSSAIVRDRPSFPHRGLLVDTSRNFMTVDVIKQIISGMSYDKVRLILITDRR